ncbi:MAG: DUF362 domain-containing protein [Bacteroidota bacterium]|jgi:uncharacterized protein (DUF362 family)
MDRRTFLKNGIGFSTLVGTGTAGLSALIPHGLCAQQSQSLPYDLIAIKGGEPDVMFTKGMEALGGIGKFVKSGQRVVVKPNIGWDVSPARAGNTNPSLVTEIIKQCYSAGAKEVLVFDNTCDNWTRCYKNSGIEAAVKLAGGKIVPGNTEGYYHPVTISGGRNLKDAKVHELILEADVFINVPILKSHGGAQLTMSMKNLMGIVWDRGTWHRNDLHQCIADFATYRKPDLNILDAYSVMKTNGPRGVSEDDVVTMKSLLISTDMVTIDAAGAKLFGIDPYDIRHIRLAEEQKVGTAALGNLSIKRISL